MIQHNRIKSSVFLLFPPSSCSKFCDDEHVKDEEKNGNKFRKQKSRNWGVISGYFVRNCRRYERLNRKTKIPDKNAAGCWKRGEEAQVNEKLYILLCCAYLVEFNGSSIEGKVGQRNTTQAVNSPRNELLFKWKQAWRYILKSEQLYSFVSSTFRSIFTVSYQLRIDHISNKDMGLLKYLKINLARYNKSAKMILLDKIIL